MLAIGITNLIWILPVACVFSAIIGFAVRGAQTSKLRSRVNELEKEMLNNHAEILALQKENTLLQDKLKNNSVPVIPITGSSKENAGEGVPDVASRKKLLSSSANTHS
ncbi:MAG TPA: hypothetical protein VD996_06500 [Chitinophagaceae bacterium]|nr:hypothetical protein [Chitinophagaceae bacterium]